MSDPKPVRNVLYIMCDQLRRDYLSCYGHAHLHTPNIDRMTAAGVRLSRAYTQGTICGPSRKTSWPAGRPGKLCIPKIASHG